ncbi:hypothetical protein B0H19DRAFT_1258013 [Mycena capillaripes]|nr:hypothetical protein B0H19DRAFT_1258013 [Mycena capillaripes]
MAAVHSTLLPASLDPLSAQFSTLSTKSDSEEGYVLRKATIAPILDPEEIKKALFETAYEPSESFWTEAQASYQKPAEDPLPEGFPVKVTGPQIWNGKELINKPEQWLHTFTADEVADVDNAIEHFISLNLGFSEISRDTFPLKILNKALDKAVDEIFNGIGLRIFRGLPVQKYDRKSHIIAFAGISAYIGEHRYRQIGSAAAIVPRLDGARSGVRPSSSKAKRPEIKFPHGRGRHHRAPHTRQGGDGQLYNTFADTRRDILRALASNYYSRYNVEGSPFIHYAGDRVVAQYGRRAFFPFFEDQSAANNVPPLTKEQDLALDALHFTAEKVSLDIDLQPGDLEFFNNLSVFHARTASEDSKENIRHLLRIWLRNETHQTPRGGAQKGWDRLAASEVQYPVEAWPLETWDVVSK